MPDSVPDEPVDRNPPREALQAPAVPPELVAPFKPDLDADERLIWAGVSWPTWGQSGGWWKALLAGFAAVGVAAGTLAAFFDPRFKAIETLCGTIAVVAGSIGFLILVGGLMAAIDAWREGRATRGVLYALTDRRAILRRPVAGSRGIEVQSIPRGSVRTLHRVEYPDGSGDLVFALADATPGLPTVFAGIADIQRVESLARLTLLTPPSRAGDPHSQGAYDR